MMNATVVVPSNPMAIGADPSFWYGLQTAHGDGALIQPILAWGQTYPDGFGIFHEVFDWNNQDVCCMLHNPTPLFWSACTCGRAVGPAGCTRLLCRCIWLASSREAPPPPPPPPLHTHTATGPPTRHPRHIVVCLLTCHVSLLPQDSRSPEHYRVYPGDVLTQGVVYKAADNSYDM
jgi:hypothetical protein